MNPDTDFSDFESCTVTVIATQVTDLDAGPWHELTPGVRMSPLFGAGAMLNLLDASGSIGVTERTAYVLRVRQLAVAICKQYASEEEAVAAAARAQEEEF